ncbi:MAG: hypothetical protein KDD19_01220 [Phaeodactylibacter sp.]|nr:hypothetical protein [Phaeodactylibacter sp.]MCB9050817.1 hypothetical protein [Lewinellaceae bacterium]
MIVEKMQLFPPAVGLAIDNQHINDPFLGREAEKLWVATDDGASALDLRTENFSDFTFYQKNAPLLTDGECTAIFRARDGVLWFGVNNRGLGALT